MAEKMFEWGPYNYGFNNPIFFIDPDGMAPDNEYLMVHNSNGTTTSTKISNEGGDQKDIIHHTNGLPMTQNGFSGYTETVENTTGGQRLAPGEFAARASSGQVTPVDDPLSSVQNAGLKFGAGLLVLGVKEGGKDIADRAAKKYTISEVKTALKKVYEKLGIDKALPKGEEGKFGSPTAGDTRRGYRLDPAHPNKPAGDPESVPHINYWDYSGGKRSRNPEAKDVIPIIKP